MNTHDGKCVPRLSVLMAAYNRERTIAEAVTSILKQEFGDFELIVVDDGSTDRTFRILNELARSDDRIKLLSQEKNAGVAAARNLGLSRARGEYTAIMDSDDISLPSRFKLQIEYLDKHPHISGVGSRYFFIDAHGRKTGPRRYVHDPAAEPLALPSKPGDVRLKMMEKGVLYFLHATAMFRTRTLREAGGYRSAFKVAEDSDLHLRLLTGGHELANLPELLYYYRQSDDNLSSVTMDVLLYRLAALAAAHRRLQGLDDLIDIRTEPFTYDFLMALMKPVGLSVWLEWIGLLQYHRCSEPDALVEAWLHVLSMPGDDALASDVTRHWRTLALGWPNEAAALAKTHDKAMWFLEH